MNDVPITLIGKPGCHLCDDARAVIEQVRAELRSKGQATTLVERNILEDEALARRYSEAIPVVLVGAKQHAMWRVDATKLARAIERQAVGPLGLFRRG